MDEVVYQQSEKLIRVFVEEVEELVLNSGDDSPLTDFTEIQKARERLSDIRSTDSASELRPKLIQTLGVMDRTHAKLNDIAANAPLPDIIATCDLSVQQQAVLSRLLVRLSAAMRGNSEFSGATGE